MHPADYRARRELLGYTQAGLAEALGISRETVTRREAGDPRNPISREAELALSALPEVKHQANAPFSKTRPIFRRLN